MCLTPNTLPPMTDPRTDTEQQPMEQPNVRLETAKANAVVICGAEGHPGLECRPDTYRGCGEVIADREDEYRCMDCQLVMHPECLRRHCGALDEKDALITTLQRDAQRWRSRAETAKAALRAIHDRTTCWARSGEPGEPASETCIERGVAWGDEMCTPCFALIASQDEYADALIVLQSTVEAKRDG